MSLVDILLREGADMLTQVMGIRTERQIRECDDAYARGIVAYANELCAKVFLPETALNRPGFFALARSEQDFVLERLVAAHNDHAYDPLAMQENGCHHMVADTYFWLQRQDHSAHSYQETMRELIKTLCERSNLEYPTPMQDVTFVGYMLNDGAPIVHGNAWRA